METMATHNGNVLQASEQALPQYDCFELKSNWNFLHLLKTLREFVWFKEKQLIATETKQTTRAVLSQSNNKYSHTNNYQPERH